MAESRNAPAQDGAAAARVGPIAALAHPGFRLLWFGGLFSGAAQQMQLVVNGYVIYELTGSPLQLGLNGLFAAIPILAFSLLGAPSPTRSTGSDCWCLLRGCACPWPSSSRLWRPQ